MVKIRKIYTKDVIEEELKENNFKLIKINKFNGIQSKIKIKCLSCGEIYDIIFNNLKRRGCKYCKETRINTKIAKERIYDLVGDEYTLESEYSSTDYIYLRHNTCEKIYKVKYQDFISNGHRCSCNKYDIYNGINKLKEKISEIHPSLKFIKIKDNLKEYNNSSKVVLKCEKGHIFEISIHNLVNNKRGCTKCSYSKQIKNLRGESFGTKILLELFNELDIKYEREKKYKDLRSPYSNKRLRYDFYLEDYNVLIEYDGKQHFYHSKNNKIFNEEKYLKIKNLDSMKDEYAKKNNIRLLRINYKENKEEIIEKVLKFIDY